MNKKCWKLEIIFQHQQGSSQKYNIHCTLNILLYFVQAMHYSVFCKRNAMIQRAKKFCLCNNCI